MFIEPKISFQLVCTVAIITLVQACSRPQVTNRLPWFNAADVQVHIENGLLVDQHNTPFTGMIYALAPNKKDTTEIVGFNQGREHGAWKKFYPDGRPADQRFFVNGKKEGEYKAWWPNGAKKLIYRFKNGEYQGNCRAWAADGLMIEDMNYQNGYEAGRQVQYYADGRIKANYIMTNGRRYGLLGTKNCTNVTDSVFKK